MPPGPPTASGADGIQPGMPLLATKLTIPPVRPNVVSRPRLLARLARGAACPLTLVSAPAGFGKTTLVAEWLNATPRAAAWLSLGQGDDDPARFWSYVIAALQTVHPRLGETPLAALRAPQPPPIEHLLTALLNEVAALPDPLLLVLDDYHLIEAHPVHEAVAFALAHAPPALRLAILTRADPPLPLSRMRVRGQLCEIRAADLRFTPDEAAAFLNGAMGLTLPAADVAALEARTEGWIAGLQLAALSMQEREDVAGFISAFSGGHHYIVDYLAEEVLARQPAGMREFLLKTSVLDRLSGPLCDALTGRGDGQATLEALEKANLFVVPLDEERRWYRYHHLFADVLRARLRRTWPDQVSALQQRASEWHEGQGSLEEAIGYALAGHAAGERAAALIERLAPTMLAQGRIAGLSAWIDALPVQIVVSCPRLGLTKVWLLFLGYQFEQMEAWLDEIEGRLPPDSAALAGEALLLRGVSARMRAETERSLDLSRRALARLPGTDTVLRGRALMQLGLAYLEVDAAEAQEALAKARTDYKSAGDLHGTLAACYFLAWAQVLRGSLRQAMETGREALLVAEKMPHSPAASYAHVAMGDLLYEANDLARSAAHLEKGIALAELSGNADVLLKATLAWARLHRARGEWEEAQRRIDEAEQVAHGRSIPTRGDEQVRLWLAQGRSSEATQWVRDKGQAIKGTTPYIRALYRIVQARVLVAQHLGQEALPLLAEARREAEEGGMTGLALQVLSLEALALQAEGQEEQAQAALSRALSLAEDEGYVRTFVDVGAPMAELLRAAGSRGNALQKAYAAKLLSAMPEGAGVTGPAIQPLVEPLSERELEVLRLLAAGRSNREIGDALYIVVGTVKKHLNNIYGKMGVQNRTECAVRARELGLV